MTSCSVSSWSPEKSSSISRKLPISHNSLFQNTWGEPAAQSSLQGAVSHLAQGVDDLLLSLLLVPREELLYLQEASYQRTGYAASVSFRTCPADMSSGVNMYVCPAVQA